MILSFLYFSLVYAHYIDFWGFAMGKGEVLIDMGSKVTHAARKKWVKVRRKSGSNMGGKG